MKYSINSTQPRSGYVIPVTRIYHSNDRSYSQKDHSKRNYRSESSEEDNLYVEDNGLGGRIDYRA